MWMFFGVTAIVTALLNVIRTVLGREAKWFRFISLSATALTLCAFYAQAKAWVLLEYWDSLIDVVPTLSGILWFLTIASILINGITLFAGRKEK